MATTGLLLRKTKQ